jgi:hypothetical protein
MVGHFLHQNRKSRTGTGSGSTNGSTSSNIGNNNLPLNAFISSSSTSSSHQHLVAATANLNQDSGYYPQHPNVAFAPPPRYAATSMTTTSTYDMSSMQFHPPQHLTAEAVAALPPPGTYGANLSIHQQSLFLLYVVHLM